MSNLCLPYIHFSELYINLALKKALFLLLFAGCVYWNKHHSAIVLHAAHTIRSCEYTHMECFRQSLKTSVAHLKKSRSLHNVIPCSKSVLLY